MYRIVKAVRNKQRLGFSLKYRGQVTFNCSDHRYWSGVDLREAERVVEEVSKAAVTSIERVVPWFSRNMPVCYSNSEVLLIIEN